MTRVLSMWLSHVRHDPPGVTPNAGARSAVKVAPRAVLIVLFALAGLVNQSFADPQKDQANAEGLKQLSLADLANIEVTSTSKEPGRALEDASSNLRCYSGRHSPFRCHEHPGSTPSCTGSRGSTNQLQSVVCEHSRTWEWFLEISVGID